SWTSMERKKMRPILCTNLHRQMLLNLLRFPRWLPPLAPPRLLAPIPANILRHWSALPVTRTALVRRRRLLRPNRTRSTIVPNPSELIVRLCAANCGHTLEPFKHYYYYNI